MGAVELVSERLLLREFVATDEEAVHAYACDALVTRYMEWGPNSRAQTRQFLAEKIAAATAEDRSQFAMAVVPAVSDGVVGSVALDVDGDDARREGVLGYVFHRDWWSRGYATEASKALVQFGFGQLKLSRITATCHPDNKASARVLQKVGLTYQGRIHHHMKVRGIWRDSLVFATAPS
jgi:ribosomal-protein-alanine N-acetyltransferase